MRESYGKVQDHLQTTQPDATSEERIRLAFKEQLLSVAGFKKEEMEGMDLGNISDEELHCIIRERLLGVMVNNGSKQKVIPMGDVENYLAQGWEYVSSLPNERAILRVPL